MQKRTPGSPSPEICGRMKMSRREVLAYLKQLSARGYVKIRRKQHPTSALQNWDASADEECRHRHETFTQFLEYVGVEQPQLQKKTPAAWNMWQAMRPCSRSIISSTTEAPLSVSSKKTDLRYYYEPGDYTFHDGHLLHGKNLPEKTDHRI